MISPVRQLQRLAALRASVDLPVNDERGPSSYTPPPRQATPRKQALWKAVHHAKLQGVSPRGIARQLGISRNTVRKYVELTAPPHQPDSQTDHPISNSEPHQRTFSLSNHADIFAGQRQRFWLTLSPAMTALTVTPARERPATC